MNGFERVSSVCSGGQADRIPFVPILHSGLAGLFGVPLGAYFTDAATMADVMVRGYRHFGYDGVQLSLGVTAEAEAFGAAIDQPIDDAPHLKSHVVVDRADLQRLRAMNPVERGRFPHFRQAVERVVQEIGGEGFVIATLRGPLLMASQLRGAPELLMDMIEAPDAVAELLEFTTETTLRLGQAFTDTGAHAVVLGEATCSPSFISPEMYRTFVCGHHRRLVTGLRAAGWKTVGLHICGNLLPILDDVLSTGVNLLDIDHQVPPQQALAINAGRAVLRGNLDPSRLFAFGTEATIRAATARLKSEVAGQGHWIYGSGCDISPGSPEKNIKMVMKELYREDA